MTREKLNTALIALRDDLKRMEHDRNFDIFDCWEIGEIHFYIGEAVKALSEEKT